MTADDETVFGSVAPVNIPEAVQCRRLYTVGNYILAGVTDAITSLNSRLTSNTNGAAPTFTKKADLAQEVGKPIDDFLKRANEEFNTQDDLMRELRSWFDLGTASAPVVNVDFKSAFRNFASVCADDLFGVDPDMLAKDAQGQELYERLLRLYRDAKRRVVDLVESMSDSGTLGSDRLIGKWSSLVEQAFQILPKLRKYLATDDSDKLHIWSIVADLVSKQRADIIPNVVHARQGGALLDDAIALYQLLQATPKAMNEEDPGALKTVFNTLVGGPGGGAGAVGGAGGAGAAGGGAGAAPPAGTTVARKLRSNATFVLASWPWA